MRTLLVLRFGFCVLAASAAVSIFAPVHAQGLYLMPRYVTRQRMHAEAVHRGDAIRRQRALEAARATNNVQTNATSTAAAPSSNNSTSNNNNPSSTPTPTYYPPVQPQPALA